MDVQSLSLVQLCPWNFKKKEQSETYFPTPGGLPDPEIKLRSSVSPACGFFTTGANLESLILTPKWIFKITLYHISKNFKITLKCYLRNN